MMAFIAELSCVFWVEQGYIGLVLAIATICSFLLVPCSKKKPSFTSLYPWKFDSLVCIFLFFLSCFPFSDPGVVFYFIRNLRRGFAYSMACRV